MSLGVGIGAVAALGQRPLGDLDGFVFGLGGRRSLLEVEDHHPSKNNDEAGDQEPGDLLPTHPFILAP